MKKARIIFLMVSCLLAQAIWASDSATASMRPVAGTDPGTTAYFPAMHSLPFLPWVPRQFTLQNVRTRRAYELVPGVLRSRSIILNGSFGNIRARIEEYVQSRNARFVESGVTRVLSLQGGGYAGLDAQDRVRTVNFDRNGTEIKIDLLDPILLNNVRYVMHYLED